jgi:hypothetical protein
MALDENDDVGPRLDLQERASAFDNWDIARRLRTLPWRPGRGTGSVHRPR